MTLTVLLNSEKKNATIFTSQCLNALLADLLFSKKKNLVDQFKSDDLDAIDHKPVWFDEDDNPYTGSNIKEKKNNDKRRKKFERLMGTPAWAQMSVKSEADDEVSDEILRTVGHLKTVKSNNLKKDIIECKKLPKINSETVKEGPIISCIEFHPNASVALVAGQSGLISLFAIGGDTNKKLHGFHLLKWNITAAHFTPDGNKAFLASANQKTYCMYDLIKAEHKSVALPNVMKNAFIFELSPNGKYLATSDGYDEMYIICSVSKELLRCLKHNTNIKAVTFSHNSEQIFSYGINGEITVWDMSTFKPLKKFYDQGCVNASCLVNSRCGKLLATGSAEGIVNIYETSNIVNYEPLPVKTISNLTTKITNLKFNATTEILAMSSSYYPNAVKLVHLPSYHVFSNFPQPSLNLYNVHLTNFSPNSGYMGLGNDHGSALLYRLKHYKSY